MDEYLKRLQHTDGQMKDTRCVCLNQSLYSNDFTKLCDFHGFPILVKTISYVIVFCRTQ